MIYIDHTEGRDNTRLSQSILDISKPIIGLETQTGADILITPLDEPLPPNVNIPPAKPVLKRHCEAGMLIQRKSGGDLLGSIPKLTDILQRMQQASPVCWLLICGRYENHDGKIFCEGRPTEWLWSSMKGATDAWQLRGGHLHEEFTDADGADWLARWNRNIGKLNRDIIIGKPVQKIVGGMFDPMPWRSVLMALPDCGPELSQRIAEHCGSLAHSLWWITEPTGFGKIPGITDSKRKAWARYMGLKEDEVLMPIAADQKYFVTEVPQPEKIVESSVLFDLNAVKELAA